MATNITKKNLIDDIVDRTFIKEPQVRPVVEEFLKAVERHLLKGECIEIRGFGTFSVQRRKGRPARNPRTGEQAAIPERFIPILKFSPSVRESVDRKQKGAV